METVACNIGPQNQKWRKNVGMILLVFAGFVSAFMIAFDVPTLQRIVVFPLFAGGFISLLQAARKVCVTNALQKKVQVD